MNAEKIFFGQNFLNRFHVRSGQYVSPVFPENFSIVFHRFDIDCTVLIRIIVKNGQLLFETENTVMKEKKEKTPAIGIENCRKRLELLYPDRFNLTTVQENRQYKIRLTIRLQ